MRHGQIVSSLLLLLVPAGALAGRRVADPAAALRPAGIQYLSPLPGSALHPPATTIAIRPGDALDRDVALEAGRWTVTGAASGVHPGTLALSSDARTVTFRPAVPFAAGERVHVAIAPGTGARSGAALPALDWWFDVRAGDEPALRAIALHASRDDPVVPAVAPETGTSAKGPARTLAGPLPSDYPPIEVVTSDRPDTVGGIFLSPFSALSGTRGRLLVVDHRAQPLFYRSLPRFAFDFRPQPNGLLTYWSEPGLYYGIDSTCTVVDSFACGNGYVTDEHELQLLPNGHALLLAYDPVPYPMDTVVAGGDPNAIVIGLIVQEIDEAKNVVFQWRSWDHFRVTDLVECMAHLTDPIVDDVHGNAIEEDFDGNLLISSRHLSEITKIDRATGDVLWRMGPHAKNNQFTFYDDQTGFSHQHDIRRLPNGDITLFDNGNCVSPHSRTVEYHLDETNLTAELIQEYEHTPPLSTPFMGNRQRRGDGSVTIGWGGSSVDPKVTELHPDGSVALELGLGAGNHWSYRAIRFPWETTAFLAEDQLAFGDVAVGEQVLRPIHVKNGLATLLHVNQFETTDPAFAVVSPDSLVLFPGASGTVMVRFTPSQSGAAGADLYVRAVNDTEIVTRVTHLTGSGTALVGVTDGSPVPRLALGSPVPNPAHERTSIPFELPRPVRLSLQVFDVRGRRVAELVDGFQAAGRHSVVWSTRGRAAGVYFVRMTADGRTFSRRVTVTR